MALYKHFHLFLNLVQLLFYFNEASSFDSLNVVLIIVSQTEPYHASVAARLKEDIQSQIYKVENRLPVVHLTHEDFTFLKAWAIIPLLIPLYMLYRGSDVRWVVFLESHTVVQTQLLMDALAKADVDPQSKWLGYTLREPGLMEKDALCTYPYFSSGFAMRLDLIQSHLPKIKSVLLKSIIRMNPGYELAKLFREPIISDPHFCVGPGKNCAAYPRLLQICGWPIREETIYFAVKTWSGNHGTRLPVLKRTWGRHVTNLAFYSDQNDPSIPTIKTGVPNTGDGHCSLTLAILKMSVEAVKFLPEVQWIFLADDDTVLGVHRLCKVLSCYRGGKYNTLLAERFGHWLVDKSPNGEDYGYDYPTGGGGIAFSVGAARVLTKCTCAYDAFPDDMMLGMCAVRMGIEVTHSPLFHQFPPGLYHWDALVNPVSFHSSDDTAKIYTTWFERDDLAMKRQYEDL